MNKKRKRVVGSAIRGGQRGSARLKDWRGGIDEVRGRGGKKEVLDAEAPFSAAPYSLFLSPLFVGFCLQWVDRRQHISAASAALVRQMGRDERPRPGLARPPPRPGPPAHLPPPRLPAARRPPAGLGRGGNEHPPGPRRSPGAAPSPPVPPTVVAAGACCRGDGEPRSVEERNRKRQTKPLGRRRGAHAGGGGNEEGRPKTAPSSREPGGQGPHSAGGATSTCAGRRGWCGLRSRAPAGAGSSATGSPGCPTRRLAQAARPLPAAGRTSKVGARSEPRAGPEATTGQRQARSARPGGGPGARASWCDSQGF